MSHSLYICLSSSQGHVPWPVSQQWQPCMLCMEKMKIFLMCGWGIETGAGAEAQELTCLPLSGQQEVGLSCPDGRWPPWRQSRFKLLPGLFENILGPAWVIGHMGHSAIQESPPPRCANVELWDLRRGSLPISDENRNTDVWFVVYRTIEQ